MKEFFIVQEQQKGVRLDKALALHFPAHTRHYFQNILRDGRVLVNGKKPKSSLLIKVNDHIQVDFPPLRKLKIEAKNIPLHVIYEDKNVVILDKPAGMVVHPGTHGSHSEDSLVNALLYHCQESLGGIGGALRPGIVHRLDKDTSGVLVVAKNDQAQQQLSAQFKHHQVDKIYYALVVGHLMPSQGTIEAPIGRDATNRKKMAVSHGGKMAMSHYKVVVYYPPPAAPTGLTLVEVKIATGRTHQIRVHFASIGFPLVGDQTYGKAKINHFFEKEYGLHRQFLHAAKLGILLPESTKKAEFQAPLPFDLQSVLDHLGQAGNNLKEFTL